jgi:hypothetical protein
LNSAGAAFRRGGGTSALCRGRAAAAVAVLKSTVERFGPARAPLLAARAQRLAVLGQQAPHFPRGYREMRRRIFDRRPSELWVLERATFAD